MKRVLPFFVCAALAACGGGGGDDRQQAQQGPASYTVQLTGGQPQTLPNEPLMLILANVSDSRCPATAQCVWAGQAVLTVTAAQTGVPAVDLALSLDATQPKVPAQATYRNYVITLQALEPGVPPTGGLPLSAYKATLRVERPY
jgi:hypothetical protein